MDYSESASPMAGMEGLMAERQVSRSLAYGSASEMMFGTAKQPVQAGAVTVGGGRVVPEVNFTLPAIAIEEATITAVTDRFADMVRRICERAVALQQDALVLEFEQLFELTKRPEWGAQICAAIKDVTAGFDEKYGLKTALRATIADIRDEERPPKMRTGDAMQRMLAAFDQCAAAGADILSIESTGGKEVHDQALLQADLEGLAYGIGVLAPADMEFLWGAIADIAAKHGCVAGGDTACGFGNTAMQLAHQKMIPSVLAAVSRLLCAPRSLVAVEMGATGPLKDCGYENPVLKAIAGVPISMEGKSSACAHSSPVGNIAAACCDLWSNESVQDVRLLGGFAPECFAEVLVYDCRLMNQALATGQGPALQSLFVATDVDRDPQARVLDPAVMYEAARRIVEAGPSHYDRMRAVANYAIEVLTTALDEGSLTITEREMPWFAMIQEAAINLPADPAVLREKVDLTYGELYLAAEYGL